MRTICTTFTVTLGLIYTVGLVPINHFRMYILNYVINNLKGKWKYNSSNKDIWLYHALCDSNKCEIVLKMTLRIELYHTILQWSVNPKKLNKNLNLYRDT